ncbi:hypothetical protein HDU79_003420 [Rhizoclosmatium sp. JEL0117]|nr:hypothetical protein HDU79_003420 [Rhizoclosmatium sp. JEL0117]
MPKIFCVLVGLPEFTVDFDVSLTVGEFKRAIRAERKPDLDSMASDKLLLVRVFKGDVGGFSMDQLETSKEALNLMSHGNDVEEAGVEDKLSMFRTTVGASLMVNGMTFKVMNPKEKVSVFTDSLPAELFHILVLGSKQTFKKIVVAGS